MLFRVIVRLWAIYTPLYRLFIHKMRLITNVANLHVINFCIFSFQQIPGCAKLFLVRSDLWIFWHVFVTKGRYCNVLTVLHTKTPILWINVDNFPQKSL